MSETLHPGTEHNGQPSESIISGSYALGYKTLEKLPIKEVKALSEIARYDEYPEGATDLEKKALLLKMRRHALQVAKYGHRQWQREATDEDVLIEPQSDSKDIVAQGNNYDSKRSRMRDLSEIPVDILELMEKHPRLVNVAIINFMHILRGGKLYPYTKKGETGITLPEGAHFKSDKEFTKLFAASLARNVFKEHGQQQGVRQYQNAFWALLVGGKDSGVMNIIEQVDDNGKKRFEISFDHDKIREEVVRFFVLEKHKKDYVKLQEQLADLLVEGDEKEISRTKARITAMEEATQHIASSIFHSVGNRLRVPPSRYASMSPDEMQNKRKELREEWSTLKASVPNSGAQNNQVDRENQAKILHIKYMLQRSQREYDMLVQYTGDKETSVEMFESHMMLLEDVAPLAVSPHASKEAKELYAKTIALFLGEFNESKETLDDSMAGLYVELQIELMALNDARQANTNESGNLFKIIVLYEVKILKLFQKMRSVIGIKDQASKDVQIKSITQEISVLMSELNE